MPDGTYLVRSYVGLQKEIFYIIALVVWLRGRPAESAIELLYASWPCIRGESLGSPFGTLLYRIESYKLQLERRAQLRKPAFVIPLGFRGRNSWS